MGADDGRFYYHAYLREQPDLDWRNPDVRAAMLDVLRFWCERGADGFRIDALRQLIKDDQRRDNPPNPAWREGDDPYSALVPEFTTDRPEVQDAIRDMRAAVGDERLLIGELYLPIERLVAYYAVRAGHAGELPPAEHAVGAARDRRARRALRGRAARRRVAELGARQPRPAARRDAARPGQERAAAYLLLTLRGTPTLYYGDELGMRDVEIAPERRVDPWRFGNRDPVRTPMQWDAGRLVHRAAEPWLPFAPDHATRQRRRPARGPGLAAVALPRPARAAPRASPTSLDGAYRTL